MKKILLSIAVLNFVLVSRGQVLFNEVYTDPAAGNNEFFELYNASTSSTPLSMNDYTIVTYFETPKQKGFYVMDLPNLTISPKGYFVGASDSPFNYQGVVNSGMANFSWNSPSFTANNGYVREWLYNPGDPSDGNANYDTVALPSNFNDFFFRRTGVGPTYTIFLFNKGVLIDALIFGTGGVSSVLPSIIAMPPLFVDMSGSSPDFTVNFSGYGSIPLETVMQDAGNDNGYYRSADGLCGGWLKSDAQSQHTPGKTNGSVDGYSGTISVTAIIQRGTAATGSKIVYDVISAPSTSFPVTMDVYKDDGSVITKLDAGDDYVESNTENKVSDGPFTTLFTPYDANMLVVVKSNIGCIDKVMFVPNLSILPIKLIYFQGNLQNGKVTLQWDVAQNELSGRFEIEKSADGKNFTAAGVVSATDKPGLENYSFTDAMTSDKIYYRLKMYDKNMSAQYSRALAFKQDGNSAGLKIINNPATDRLTIQFSSASSQQAQIKVYDLGGRLQMSQTVNVYQGNNLISLPLSSSLKNGAYAVELNNGNDKQAAKFIKQ